MIVKSVMFLLFCSSISYGNSVVKFTKDDDSLCMINRSIGEDTNCSKKDTYFLKVDDKVKSTKLKIGDFTYITGNSSVFVSEIDDGYKIEKSFLAYFASLYKNHMHLNKNSTENGVSGYSNERMKLPSESKFLYGDKLEININKEDVKKIKECLLENFEGKIISKGYTCFQQKVIINSEQLNKKETYTLFIKGNRQKNIKFSFIDKNELRLIRKQPRNKQVESFKELKLYIYQINQKGIK